MKVRIYAGGSLGGEAVVASSMQGGTVEMSMMGPGILTGMNKDFGIFDTPFMFNDAKEADAVMDGPVGQKLLDKLPEKGLIGLSYWDHGFRVLTNSRRPVSKMEDIQGLKIRVQQIPVFIDAFTALGANPVPMPFTELYTALETKAVDGQENPFVSIEVTKFYEVQKYASNTRHAYSPLLVLVSKRFWDQLSADERKILQDAANETKAVRARDLAGDGRQGHGGVEEQGHDDHRDLGRGAGAHARQAEAGDREAPQDDQRGARPGGRRRAPEGARRQLTSEVTGMFRLPVCLLLPDVFMLRCEGEA